MVRLCTSILLGLTLFIICSSEDSDQNESEGGWFSWALKSLGTYAYDKFYGSSNPEGEVVDVGRTLVLKTQTSDLTEINDRIRGLEFDRFAEKNANYRKEGMPIKEFDRYFRTIATAHGLPDIFILDIILGKNAKVNQSQQKNFVYRVGEDSTVMYCTVATVKNGKNTIDIAMAYYSLDFKIADRVYHHSEEQNLLGFIPWGTKHWTTTEPRKLTTDDGDLFVKFLRLKAITGYIEEHPYLAISDRSHDHHDEM